ncbi:MAG: glycosyltransferase family 9 protein [Deltaproteobacteria bacterium]|nr:glycosyltransferase family 9 protein [Deltaproteobacteria bacterium]
MESFPAARAVVVLRLSALGDVVLSTPALDALHAAWPQTRILYVTTEAFVPLVRHHPAVAAVEVRRPGEALHVLAGRLRAHAPDAVLDLHGKWQARALAWMTGASRVVTWHKRPLADTVLVKLRARPYRAAMHISARYHLAVERLVGRALPRGQLSLHVADDARARAAALLADAGVREGEIIVGMSPGANWETKRWPAERYAGLARRAGALGWRAIVTGTPAEAPLAAEVARAGAHVVDLTGRCGVDVLGAVIARCRAFVANDSGPMHMARALGVPVLTFFGSTDPRQFDFTGHAALYAGLQCSACSLYGLPACPLGHFRCMLDLSEQDAWTALERLVAAGVAAPVPG